MGNLNGTIRQFDVIETPNTKRVRTLALLWQIFRGTGFPKSSRVMFAQLCCSGTTSLSWASGRL
jgi:hypothetical protein